MKRRRRFWRWAKWAGLAACLVIAVAWTTNVWWSFGWASDGPRRWCGAVAYGGLWFGYWDEPRRMGEPEPGGWFVERLDEQSALSWFPRYSHTPVEYDSPGYLEFSVPLWILLVILIPPTATLVWRDLRTRPGYCTCGYSLAGLAAGVPCPECGKVPA